MLTPRWTVWAPRRLPRKPAPTPATAPRRTTGWSTPSETWPLSRWSSARGDRRVCDAGEMNEREAKLMLKLTETPLTFLLLHLLLLPEINCHALMRVQMYVVTDRSRPESRNRQRERERWGCVLGKLTGMYHKSSNFPPMQSPSEGVSLSFSSASTPGGLHMSVRSAASCRGEPSNVKQEYRSFKTAHKHHFFFFFYFFFFGFMKLT